MSPSLTRQHEFSSLSIADLLEARHAYHVHLASLDHVVGTAIGKYLIRDKDPDARDPERRLENPGPAVRTLTNSVVRPWSWPCVLVFVDRWATPAQLGRHPEQFVPPRLYLPDGRVVPTCVVYAVRDRKAPAPPLYGLDFADGLIGGGYPVLSSVQGEERIGSLGCLATDGHSVFALTNRHVAGPPGQVAYTVADGERVRIGESDGRTLGKVDFARAYPGWEAPRTQVNLDAGLVRVDDLSQWTAQVFGIGELGRLVDANVDTLSLDLIDQPVRAFGAASGALHGSVKALFYRYHSVGGFDYLADFLIGPRAGEESIPTRPGDSGTIWFWEPNEAAGREGRAAPKGPTEHRPLSLQWGGQLLEGPGGQEGAQFALASSLATVCRALDLELVTDWDVGHNEYWGKVGHYKVGAKACDLVTDPRLFRLLQRNLDRIAVSDTRIVNDRLPKQSDTFVALADVSDLVWRSRRGKEGSAHFADADQKGKGAFHGKTLLDLWADDPATLTPSTWVKFYKALGATADKDMGCLPFRVREIYEEMVDAVKKRELARYVAAAGILAHYVGDACQPLHVSHLHHGRPGHPGESQVHAVYETNMLDRFRVELVDLVNDRLDDLEIASSFRGGTAAANAAMQLMQFTVETIEPIEVIDAFNMLSGSRTGNMWQQLKDRTADCMAEGCLYLAEMWESAWVEGGGPKIPMSRMTAQSKSTIKKLYLDKSWMESDWLRNKSFA